MASTQVFSGVKNALFHGKNKSLGSDGRETNPFKNDVIYLAGRLLFGTSALQERIQALAEVGHLVHTGGYEVAVFANRLIPYLVLVMEEDIQQRSFLLQLIRTFSDLCNHNEAAVDELRKHPKCIRRIVEVVGDAEHVVDCRWACYLFTVMVCNSSVFLCDLRTRKYPELRANLERASLFPFPWEGWSCNLARRLLKLLGWYRPPNRVPSAK